MMGSIWILLMDLNHNCGSFGFWDIGDIISFFPKDVSGIFDGFMARSSIRLDTKIWLYYTYIVSFLVYWCENWATTRYLCAWIGAFDTWALHKIPRIPYARHITDAEIRAVSGCPPLFNMVT